VCVSRWDVVELGRRATAQAAAEVLDRLEDEIRERPDIEGVELDPNGCAEPAGVGRAADRGVRLNGA
jgi:hypothetical protein